MPDRLRGFAIPLLLIAAAEIYFRLGDVTSRSLAPPSAILRAGARAFGDGSLLQLTAETLLTAVSGLLIGGSVGLLLGLLLGSVSQIDRLFNFTIETLRPIPPVALIPVPILIFGVGYRMEIVLVAYACTWPVLISARDALRSVESTLYEVASALQLSTVQKITKIVLPAALGRIIVGWRIAMGLSLIVAITVEITANPLGLGYATTRAEEASDPARALAYTVWIGIIGCLISYLITNLSRKFSYGAR